MSPGHTQNSQGTSDETSFPMKHKDLILCRLALRLYCLGGPFPDLVLIILIYQVLVGVKLTSVEKQHRNIIDKYL